MGHLSWNGRINDASTTPWWRTRVSVAVQHGLGHQTGAREELMKADIQSLAIYMRITCTCGGQGGLLEGFERHVSANTLHEEHRSLFSRDLAHVVLNL